MAQQHSFRSIYDQYADMVYNLCLNYVHQMEEAQDLSQQVFVKVYQELPRFQQQASLKTWIYRITINQCLDALKAAKRKKRWGQIWALDLNAAKIPLIEADKMDHPGVSLEDKEAVAHIMGHIHALPSNQQTALILKIIEGQSQAEIAEIMGLSQKAVESLLSRARSTLKKKLQSDRRIATP